MKSLKLLTTHSTEDNLSTDIMDVTADVKQDYSHNTYRSSNPTSSRKGFEEAIADALRHFPKNRFCAKVDAGQMTMTDYHNVLKMLFHQVYCGANSLALAAAYCTLQHRPARDYLMHHAEEEMTHWSWILNDLKATGYSGPDPRDEYPPEAAEAYMAYNFFVAQTMPLRRLAIAAMLESLASIVGKGYAERMAKQLALKPTQLTFFLGHASTDIRHTKEIWQLIDSCTISPSEWGWMAHTARTAGNLYTRLYDESVR